ncbi:MAG: Nif3-like dinuclear metal center hexameric protein [Pseudomonadota bacterium]
MSRTLAEVIALLERLAPLHLSEDWDNTGLLLEPLGAALRPIERAFLCIDLSETVLDEAIERGADLLIAYHPPIFRGLKRLRARSAEERVLLGALGAGLAVYSPHTALDAAADGLNDWLARAFGVGRVTPLIAQPASRGSRGIQAGAVRATVARGRAARRAVPRARLRQHRKLLRV